jgi:dolichyl-phosphate beta-glucosyltransferase
VLYGEILAGWARRIAHYKHSYYILQRYQNEILASNDEKENMILRVICYILIWLSTLGSAFMTSSSCSRMVFLAKNTILIRKCSGVDISGLDPSSTISPFNLTIILPAYNEVNRISDTIKLYHDYLESYQRGSSGLQNYNILVIDDGSIDGTADLIRSFSYVNCLSLPFNQGKGAAIAFGVDTLPVGELCFIADADGSASIEVLDSMIRKLASLLLLLPFESSDVNKPIDWRIPALVVGYRVEVSNKSWLRSILRWGFKATVQCLAGDLGVGDTQCGCKLMTVAAAQRLYRDLHLRRWSHDVEVLYRAKKFRFPTAEIAVDWQDKLGSKLWDSPGGVVGISITMLIEVLEMRLAYEFGRWKLNELGE